MQLENIKNIEIGYGQKIIRHLEQNKIIYYTFFSALMKSVIFLLLLGSDDIIDNHIYFTGSYSGIYIIFLISFSFLFESYLRKWYLLSINFIISLLLMIDVFYFKVFNTFPSLYSIMQLKDIREVSNGLFSLFNLIYVCFFIDILVLLVVLIVKKQSTQCKKNIKVFVALIIISCLGISQMPLKSTKLHDKEYFLTKYSPFAYHIADAYAFFLEDKHVRLTSEDKAKIEKWYYDKNIEQLSDNEYKGIFKEKNLVLIQFESLEDFVINRKINGKEITPNLNMLIKNGFYFSNIYDQTGDGTSSDANLLVNTSTYPIKDGSTFYKYGNSTYNSLPRILKKYGYFSQDFYPTCGSFWNWEQNQKAFGYDKFIDCTNFNFKEEIGMGITDKDLFQQINLMMSNIQQPFLTYICNLSSHMPFDLPPEYRELDLYEELNDSYLGGYFESVHYSDKYLGEFIQNLEEKKLLNNTVIVIFGDHRGLNAYYKDEINKLKTRQDWWTVKELKVPLIIYNKDLNGEEIKTIGGLIDVLPTLLYLLDVDKNYYKDTVMGRNLLNTNENFVVLHNGTYKGGIINETKKYHAIEGLDIADMVITGDYFGKREK